DSLGREVLDVPDLRAEVGDVVHRGGILPARVVTHKAEGFRTQPDTTSGVQCHPVNSCPPAPRSTVPAIQTLTRPPAMAARLLLPTSAVELWRGRWPQTKSRRRGCTTSSRSSSSTSPS